MRIGWQGKMLNLSVVQRAHAHETSLSHKTQRCCFLDVQTEQGHLLPGHAKKASWVLGLANWMEIPVASP